MAAIPVHSSRTGNGSSTAPFLKDSYVSCDVEAGSLKIYRLTQTYLFLEEPPRDIVERNLFTEPVLDNVTVEDEVVEEPQETGKPKQKVIKKRNPKTTIEYLEL